MTLRVKGKDRQLLLYSHIINDYPDIKKILEDNEKIDEKLISRLSEQQRHFLVKFYILQEFSYFSNNFLLIMAY